MGNKLSSALKQKLIQQALQRKLQKVDDEAHSPLKQFSGDVPEKFYRFDQHPGYLQMQIIDKGAEKLGVESPFFKVHDATAGATSIIEGQEVINYASYNYLGLNGHPEVNQAAKDAVEQHGTSVSSSRIVAGERQVHKDLEASIAKNYGVDDALVYVSGHATNVTTIGYLFGAKDLIIHDEYIHNSAIIGSQLSGAKRLAFKHNNLDSLEQILKENRREFERVLIVVEGLYSMDGDFPDLTRLIQLKKEYCAFLMVDEAHSFGVLGNSGKGIREYFDVPGQEVDIWMGTLSKTLSGCGGYIAGEKALIDNLRYLSPGFLYSVGMPAPMAAASLKSIDLMEREPDRIRKLQSISKYFVDKAKEHRFDIGKCEGIAIIPIILGSSLKAAKLSSALFTKGINVQPVLYPAVPEKSARLRFFLSSEHTTEQVDYTFECLNAVM